MLTVLFCTGCETAGISKSLHSKQTIKARITYYNAHEDKWGSQVLCSVHMRAKEGVTVAAHPDFPFFKKIEIPELKGILGTGKFEVEDRGSAVTKKKASGGTCYVFDVFLSGGHKRLRYFEKYMHPYMIVNVDG